MNKLKKGQIRAGDILKITAGSMVAAVAFRYFTFPNSIVSGGITGIAQILNLLIGTPVGAVVVILNLPLFLWAWKKMGRRFVILSALCMVLVSVLVDIFALIPFDVTDDPLLASVYGGLLNGVGYGLVFSTGATGGGTDIPARFLRRKYPHVDMNIFTMCLNMAVILVFMVIFRNFESCMYTLICIFIASKVEAVLLYGPVNSRLCYVISRRSDELKNAITVQLHRGITLLDGHGAWSGQAEQVILCAVKPAQIAQLRRIVREIDPQAFMIVSDARSIYGRGFEDMEMED